MAAPHIDLVPVPRSAVRFPVALRPPRGFKATQPSTWPSVEGRLEYSKGALLYMPPCGEEQSSVAASVIWALMDWARRTPGFDVGGKEAGVILGGEVRGLDAAVWKSTGRRRTNRFRRTAPILAVEVQGVEESLEALREKAAWYLEHGTSTVWLVLPAQRLVLVVTAAGEKRLREKDRIPETPALPGLSPPVADLLWQTHSN
ncbi:MAG: Uma2 family endonuclease [Myxococcota bacterium]